MAITLTLKDAAEESGLSVRTLYTLIGQGKLRSTTVGRRRLVIAKSLEELLLGKAQRQTHEGHLSPRTGSTPAKARACDE